MQIPTTSKELAEMRVVFFFWRQCTCLSLKKYSGIDLRMAYSSEVNWRKCTVISMVLDGIWSDRKKIFKLLFYLIKSYNSQVIFSIYKCRLHNKSLLFYSYWVIFLIFLKLEWLSIQYQPNEPNFSLEFVFMCGNCFCNNQIKTYQLSYNIFLI